jgi:cell division protein FtsB
MIWDLLFSDHGYFVFKHEYQQQQVLESEIENFGIEKESLKNKIIQLRENPKVLEQVIHRELGYVYPDEYMLIMPADKYEEPMPDMIGKEEE